MKFPSITNFGPAFVVVVSTLLAWETFVNITHINNQILPKPTAILYALIQNAENILPHLQQTVLETLVGIFVAIIMGIITAILLDCSSLVRRGLYPLLITSQTIPLIANPSSCTKREGCIC
jgi:ABC-type nitrate/sulfonate/bicarbonate transport system permease component